MSEKCPRRIIVVVSHRGNLMTREAVDRLLIELALERYPNRVECAEKLGIGRSTLYRKLAEYKLEN